MQKMRSSMQYLELKDPLSTYKETSELALGGTGARFVPLTCPWGLWHKGNQYFNIGSLCLFEALLEFNLDMSSNRKREQYLCTFVRQRRIGMIWIGISVQMPGSQVDTRECSHEFMPLTPVRCFFPRWTSSVDGWAANRPTACGGQTHNPS